MRAKGGFVLIAPLWNWNERSQSSWTSCWRSNRTFMELKLMVAPYFTAACMVLIAPLWNWNGCRGPWCRFRPAVLIAPLWNWNQKENAAALKDYLGSNRTFMELKWIRRCSASQMLKHVLIAPLWNWNPRDRPWEPKISHVLIAPLWNWNNWCFYEQLGA